MLEKIFKKGNRRRRERKKKKSCHLVLKVVTDLPFEGRKVEGSQKYRKRERVPKAGSRREFLHWRVPCNPIQFNIAQDFGGYSSLQDPKYLQTTDISYLYERDNFNLVEEDKRRQCRQHVFFKDRWGGEDDILYVLHSVGLVDFA